MYRIYHRIIFNLSHATLLQNISLTQNNSERVMIGSRRIKSVRKEYSGPFFNIVIEKSKRGSFRIPEKARTLPNPAWYLSRLLFVKIIWNRFFYRIRWFTNIMECVLQEVSVSFCVSINHNKQFMTWPNHNESLTLHWANNLTLSNSNTQYSDLDFSFHVVTLQDHRTTHLSHVFYLSPGSKR